MSISSTLMAICGHLIIILVVYVCATLNALTYYRWDNVKVENLI